MQSREKDPGRQRADMSRYRSDPSQKVNWELIGLLILSCILAFTFTYKGFASFDSILYAMDLEKIAEKGVKEVPQAFNGGMSSGYYLLVYPLVKFADQAVSVSGLINGVNAAASVVLQCLLFLFFNSLLADRRSSLAACLLVIFAPTIWMLSYHGHPALLSLTFFIGSLYVLDKICLKEADGRRTGSLWSLFILLCFAAVSVRVDIALAFGAYFGLHYYRRSAAPLNLLKTFCALLAVLFILLGMRYCVLGYVIDPGGGTVAFHIATRLESENLLRNVLKNCAMWIVAADALVVLVAGIGVLRLGPTSGPIVLLFAWAAPWCVFLPFRDIGVSRLIAPTVPIIALISVICIKSVFRNRTMLALAVMFVLAQLTAEALYYPLARSYPFKAEFEGRTLARVPLGFPPVDHHYRQRSILTGQRIADTVARERKKDVLIITPGVYYAYVLRNLDDVVSREKLPCGGFSLWKHRTKQNAFYVFRFEEFRPMKELIRTALGCLDTDQVLVHLPRAASDDQNERKRLYLTERELGAILAE